MLLLSDHLMKQNRLVEHNKVLEESSGRSHISSQGSLLHLRMPIKFRCRVFLFPNEAFWFSVVRAPNDRSASCLFSVVYMVMCPVVSTAGRV